MAKQPTPKMTKEEKEAEFVDAVERMLGFPLMEWQKPILLYIRLRSLSGQSIDFSIVQRRN